MSATGDGSTCAATTSDSLCAYHSNIYSAIHYDTYRDMTRESTVDNELTQGTPATDH